MRSHALLVLSVLAFGAVHCSGETSPASPLTDTGAGPSGDATLDDATDTASTDVATTDAATNEVTTDVAPSPDVLAACARYVDGQHLFLSRCAELRSVDAVNHLAYREEAIRRCVFSSQRSGVTVTLEKLDACSTALATAACTADWPTACAFRGTIKTGSSCSAGWQCTSGSCSTVGLDGDCGVCLGGDGDACNSGLPCGNGFRCEGTKCVAVTAGGAGAACDGVRYCEFGLRCVGGSCVATEGSLCAGSTCPQLYRCTTANTCTLATRAKEGEACGGTTICESLLDCDGGRCVKRTFKPKGASCSSDLECSTMRCDRTTKRCVERWPDGTACTLSEMSSCMSSWCISGTCRLPESLACPP